MDQSEDTVQSAPHPKVNGSAGFLWLGAASYAAMVWKLCLKPHESPDVASNFYDQVPWQAYAWPAVALFTAAILNLMTWAVEHRPVKQQLCCRAFYISAVACAFELLAWGRVAPVHMTASGRPVSTFRYVMWLHATPAMLCTLSVISNFSGRRVRWLVAADVLMIGSALAGELGEGLLRWCCLLGSFLPFPFILRGLWGMYTQALQETHDSRDAASLRALRVFTVLVWGAFPVVWSLGRLQVVGVGAEEVLWACMDCMAKIVFSTTLLHGNFMAFDHRRREAMKAVEEAEGVRVLGALLDELGRREHFAELMTRELRRPLTDIIALSSALLDSSSNNSGGREGRWQGLPAWLRAGVDPGGGMTQGGRTKAIPGTLAVPRVSDTAQHAEQELAWGKEVGLGGSRGSAATSATLPAWDATSHAPSQDWEEGGNGSQSAGLAGGGGGEECQQVMDATGGHHLAATPLALAGGAAGGEVAGGCLDATAAELVSLIRNSGAWLLCLVDDLLDAAALQQGQLPLVPGEVDLSCLAAQAVHLASPLVPPGVRVSNRVSSFLPHARGDPPRLLQILYNLIANSCKFTERGAIWVDARIQGDDELAVSVHDTGIGVPQDKLEQIFKPFQQVDMSSSRRYSGMGLGLTLCRQLVEAQGGLISAESGEGGGTTVTFTLKVWKSCGTHPALPPSTPLSLDPHPPPPAQHLGAKAAISAAPAVQAQQGAQAQHAQQPQRMSWEARDSRASLGVQPPPTPPPLPATPVIPQLVELNAEVRHELLQHLLRLQQPPSSSTSQPAPIPPASVASAAATAWGQPPPGDDRALSAPLPRASSPPPSELAAMVRRLSLGSASRKSLDRGRREFRRAPQQLAPQAAAAVFFSATTPLTPKAGQGRHPGASEPPGGVSLAERGDVEGQGEGSGSRGMGQEGKGRGRGGEREGGSSGAGVIEGVGGNGGGGAGDPVGGQEGAGGCALEARSQQQADKAEAQRAQQGQQSAAPALCGDGPPSMPDPGEPAGAARRAQQDGEGSGPLRMTWQEAVGKVQRQLARGEVLVLVADDDPLHQMLVQRALGRAGVKVAQAPDGLRALDTLEDLVAGGHPPDALLLNIMMPEMGGVEVVRGVRRRHPVLPILVMSASRSEGEAVRALEAGADDFLAKPFSPGELLARLQAHMQTIAFLQQE